MQDRERLNRRFSNRIFFYIGVLGILLNEMKKILCSILLLLCFVHILHSQQKEYKAYLVATAHFDTQWNWDVRESIDDYLHRTMVQNFWLFERFPNYIFNFESAQKYAWMKERHKENASA